MESGKFDSEALRSWVLDVLMGEEDARDLLNQKLKDIILMGRRRYRHLSRGFFAGKGICGNMSAAGRGGDAKPKSAKRKSQPSGAMFVKITASVVCFTILEQVRRRVEAPNMKNPQHPPPIKHPFIG